MISVIKKELHINGALKVVGIIAMGEEQGLTLPQVAELLGVRSQNILQIANRHSVNLTTMSYLNASTLRNEGVVARRGAPPKFINQAGIRALVKHVNTPEAWEIYNQLWEIAEKPEVAMAHHTALALVTDSLPHLASTLRHSADVIEKLEGERKELAEKKGLTAEQYEEIKTCVYRALARAGYFPHDDIKRYPYSDLMKRFNVHAVAAIPSLKFDEAKAYMESWKMSSFAKLQARKFKLSSTI